MEEREAHVDLLLLVVAIVGKAAVEEDAVARMDELGHHFFVYVDAESERVQILYARNDGDLGLIEPMVGGEYTKGRSRSNGRH